MRDFVHTLQSKLADAKPNFRDDDSVLGFLCSAYYDENCTDDSEEIEDAFDFKFTELVPFETVGDVCGYLENRI